MCVYKWFFCKKDFGHMYNSDLMFKEGVHAWYPVAKGGHAEEALKIGRVVDDVRS